MPASRNKQAERSAAKKTSRVVDDEPTVPADGGDFIASAKSMVLDSCIAQVGPSLLPVLKTVAGDAKQLAAKSRELTADKENVPNNTDTKEGEENAAEVKATEDSLSEEDNSAETKGEDKVGDAKDPTNLFQTFKTRLTWHNSLGLWESDEASKDAWLAMKGQEIDFGPRAKRKGSPGLERIKFNLTQNMPHYAHILLLIMMLRAFLFRSFFACLPWLFFYQFASVALPLSNLEMLPQIPLDKVPVHVRVVATAALHAFMVLFFVYELLWCTYFFEKIPLAGLIAYHAYAVRPAGA